MPRTSTWIKGFSASTLSLGDGAARAALPRPLCRLSERARPDHGQPGVGARRRPGSLCDRAPRPATAASPRVARPVGRADRLRARASRAVEPTDGRVAGLPHVCRRGARSCPRGGPPLAAAAPAPRRLSPLLRRLYLRRDRGGARDQRGHGRGDSCPGARGSPRRTRTQGGGTMTDALDERFAALPDPTDDGDWLDVRRRARRPRGRLLLAAAAAVAGI